jgi:hypothetical protein
MATLAFYGSGLLSLLPHPQMASFTLAMEGILQVRAAGLRPQAMTGLALFHRLPFMPDIAPPLIVVMALGACHPPGLVDPVAELHRRLPPGTLDRDSQKTGGRGLGERAGLGSQDPQQPQNQSRHIS